jgi:hypothetical protein
MSEACLPYAVLLQRHVLVVPLGRHSWRRLPTLALFATLLLLLQAAAANRCGPAETSEDPLEVHVCYSWFTAVYHMCLPEVACDPAGCLCGLFCLATTSAAWCRSLCIAVCSTSFRTSRSLVAGTGIYAQECNGLWAAPTCSKGSQLRLPA